MVRILFGFDLLNTIENEPLFNRIYNNERFSK